MRIGKGAGPDGQNLQVIPFQDRADFDANAMTPETRVWQVVDIFTTFNGSWEPNPADQFAIDQWARDAYLFPSGHPYNNTSGGGDHHIQVCVTGLTDERLLGAGVLFTSDGVQHLQPADDPALVTQRNTESSGWCNIPIFANSNPPTPGPWSVAKFSTGTADIVTGMGLPWNWHVSTFIVYKAALWGEVAPVEPPVEPPIGPGVPDIEFAKAVALSLSTQFVAMRNDANGIYYDYMQPEEVATRAVMIEQLLREAYED